LAEAAKHPIDGFIKIETEEDPKQIELGAAQVAPKRPSFKETTASLHCKACSDLGASSISAI